MAEWRPLHQQLTFRSGLEAGAQAFDPPLLPYEKSLIEAIGCTEEEYKTLVRHAMLRQRVRPAEYDHIPDVVAVGTGVGESIIVSLVLGALSTVASILLAPKPPSFEDNKKITGKRLADQVGPSRFNQATSFDNTPSLAELNRPIPIPFGERGFGADTARTGGLSLVPALVWSRVYAYGGYQAFEGVYVAGQHGLDNPDKSGIVLGTNPLTSIGDKDFAVYWSSQAGRNRPQALLYGSEGTPDSGTSGRDVFTVPTDGFAEQPHFSMSYVPSGDTTFGTSTPIHNGTGYKFNWDVISAPRDGLSETQAKHEVRARRRKIAGSYADFIQLNDDRFAGMPGEGRAYSRRMGFMAVRKKGQSVATEYETQEDVQIGVGDKATFEIYGNDQGWDDLEDAIFESADPTFVEQHSLGFKGTEVTLSDLKNSADAWRQRASDLLTIGSRWICGGGIWMVHGRAETSEVIHVRMTCVALAGGSVLGVPGKRTIREGLAGYDGLEKEAGVFFDNSYFNLCRLNVATIRPIRRQTDTIEIGIQSQVWNKASGLCNFNDVPSPSNLRRLDNNDVSLTAGRMDKYFQRSSCFNIWVRPVADAGQSQAEFQRIEQLFCVQGSAPITQNNYIRIRPEATGYYEYRLIPRTGSDITGVNADENEEVIVLQSSAGTPYKGDVNEINRKCTSSYGRFEITTQGKTTITDDAGNIVTLKVRDILHNFEFYTNPPEVTSATAVQTVNVVTGINGVSEVTNAHPIGELVPHAFVTHFLGSPVLAKGHKSIDFTITEPSRSITIRISATAEKTASSDNFKQAWAATAESGWMWAKRGIDYVSSTGNWNDKDQFSFKITMNGHDASTEQNPNFVASLTNGHYNVYALYSGQIGANYSHIIYTGSVNVVAQTVQTVPGISYGDGGGRIFEKNSQIADCSYYAEVQKSNDSGPEHKVSYVNEYIVNDTLAEYSDMTTVGLALKSSGEISGVEQLRINCGSGIKVEKLRFDERGTIGSSNNFADLVYYLLTNKTQGVGDVVPAELIDKTSLETTADFLFYSRIFFDGVLEDSESIRGFLYDTAPLQLCTFTIKNGKFGMQPALPFYKTRHEDSYGNLIAIEGGEINSDTPLDIDQIFTAGNIIEDTLQLQYIDRSQRSNIRASVTWRVTSQNDLPYESSASLYWTDLGDVEGIEQSFDLTGFCTNREQALRTARFLMSTRRRVTKTISFKTIPDQLFVEPGSYIRVITEASVYDASSNGLIREGGRVRSFTDVEPGTYDALLYGSASQEVIEAEIEITENESGFSVVEDERFHGHLFSLLTRETDYSAYQIDSLNLEEDGLVSITAVEVPTDENGHSIVAKDVLDESSSIFTVIE